jgi:aminopeptidase-like protein
LTSLLNKEESQIEEYFDRLWPILRSITGEGVRRSHDILGELLPLKRYEIPSGTEVLDWTVPQEWRVREAYVETPDGRRICDVRENNLHLLNYSVPYSGTLTKAELDKHLFSLPDRPDAIPYRTSYYKPNWGFCLAHNQRLALPEGNYRVHIDTEHFDGSLTMSEAVLPGVSDREVLFTTYTCHPSLAINELSGPLLNAFLYRRIAAWPKRRLTYRFLFGPETIGAICYLAMRGEELKQKLEAGYVVTCVGDDGAYRLKRSKRQATVAERAAIYALDQSKADYRVIDFNPSGSDEKQYCSIGYNLPFTVLTRTAFGEYPQYHTSDDNKNLINFQAMCSTLDTFEQIAQTLDMNRTVINRIVYGEPQMSKYGELYSPISGPSANEQTMALKWLIHYADGVHDLVEISNISGIKIHIYNEILNTLFQNELFSEYNKKIWIKKI